MKRAEKLRTLVKVVFVLLTGLSAAGHAVHLVHEAASSAVAALLRLVIAGFIVVTTTGELVDEIHGVRVVLG